MNSSTSLSKIWFHGNLDTLVFYPETLLHSLCPFSGLSLVFRVAHKPMFAEQIKESAPRKQYAGVYYFLKDLGH